MVENDIHSELFFRTWVNGELTGTYGSLRVPKRNDYYNTEPFGDEELIPQPAVSPPTNDFYNVELPPLNLEADCKCSGFIRGYESI